MAWNTRPLLCHLAIHRPYKQLSMLYKECIRCIFLWQDLSGIKKPTGGTYPKIFRDTTIKTIITKGKRNK